MQPIKEKREAIKKLHDSRMWRSRIDEMSDNEIIALFLRLRGQRKL